MALARRIPESRAAGWGWLVANPTYQSLSRPCSRRPTSRERGISVEEGAQILLDKQPSGQWVPIESLGAPVVFLCSDAAAQMTGAMLPIEGGWTAQ